MRQIKPVKRRIKQYVLKPGEVGYVEMPDSKCVKKTSGMITAVEGRLFVGTEAEISSSIASKFQQRK